MSFFISIFLMGIALSMDAFSLALAYGTFGVLKQKFFLLSLIVGIFHFFMPLLGFLASFIVKGNLLIGANILVSVILIIIALSMFSSLRKQEELSPLNSLLSFFLFAFTVSLDSFSLGIGLSFLYNNLLLPSFVFALTSFCFTYMGLTFGNKLSLKFGKIATLLGSILLFILAIHYFIK